MLLAFDHFSSLSSTTLFHFFTVLCMYFSSLFAVSIYPHCFTRLPLSHSIICMLRWIFDCLVIVFIVYSLIDMCLLKKCIGNVIILNLIWKISWGRVNIIFDRDNLELKVEIVGSNLIIKSFKLGSLNKLN